MPPRFGTGTISFGMRTCPASGSAYSRAAENVTWCNTAQAAARDASILDQVACSLANRRETAPSQLSQPLRTEMIPPLSATLSGRPSPSPSSPSASRRSTSISDLSRAPRKCYRRMLERFVLPTLGHYRVNQVTRPDIAKFHHDLRHTPLRCQSLLGDGLQNVQPRRDVGPASGRLESAKAHQKVSGGKARAVPEPGRTETGW